MDIGIFGNDQIDPYQFDTQYHSTHDLYKPNKFNKQTVNLNPKSHNYDKFMDNIKHRPVSIAPHYIAKLPLDHDTIEHFKYKKETTVPSPDSTVPSPDNTIAGCTSHPDLSDITIVLNINQDFLYKFLLFILFVVLLVNISRSKKDYCDGCVLGTAFMRKV